MDDTQILKGSRLHMTGVRQVGVHLVFQDVGATVRIQSDLLLSRESMSYDYRSRNIVLDCVYV